MVLFVSDVHFGRSPDGPEREKERALIACLEAHAEDVDHLYLVGDVFDGYIEYQHLVPKGYTRFQGLLARWVDRGIPVTYVLGNHDPWHRSYFSDEIGVRVAPDSVEADHFGHRLHLAHGDAHGSTHPLRSLLRPLLRHPAAVQLYRRLLPPDVGLGLARWVSRALHDEDPDPSVASALQAHAESLLERDGYDAVVFGHSHVPTLRTCDHGVYVNTGNWYDARTLARLDQEGVHLQRWNGARAEDIESVLL